MFGGPRFRGAPEGNFPAKICACLYEQARTRQNNIMVNLPQGELMHPCLDALIRHLPRGELMHPCLDALIRHLPRGE